MYAAINTESFNIKFHSIFNIGCSTIQREIVQIKHAGILKNVFLLVFSGFLASNYVFPVTSEHPKIRSARVAGCFDRSIFRYS